MAACFSGSQRKKPADKRKCSSCAVNAKVAATAGSSAGRVVAPPPEADGDASEVAGATRATDQQPPAPVDGAPAAAAETAKPAQETPPPPQPKTCAWVACGKPLVGDARDKNRCTRCKQAWYCGRACQKKHWNEGGHKKECEEPPC